MRARGDRGVDVRGEQGDDFASSNASLREEDNLLVAGRVRGAALRAHGEAHLARVPGTLHGEGRELWGGCRLGCRLERFALFLEATRDGAIDAPREASNLGPSADAVLVPARLETVELLHHLARDGDEDADARRGTESLEEFAKRRAAATDERVGVGHEGEDGTVGAVARGEERGRRGSIPVDITPPSSEDERARVISWALRRSSPHAVGARRSAEMDASAHRTRSSSTSMGAASRTSSSSSYARASQRRSSTASMSTSIASPITISGKG